MIIFVFASTKEGVIGNKNQLPWKIPADLAFFKKITANKNILMGRKTFDSIANRPLKSRMNFVLTRKCSVYKSQANLLFIDNFQQIIDEYAHNSKDIYVIGGVEIFKLFEKNCSIIYWSEIKKNYTGDVIMNLDFLKNFNKKIIIKNDEFTSYILERINKEGE